MNDEQLDILLEEATDIKILIALGCCYESYCVLFNKS